jgi:PAS domain-containing protein
VPHVELSLTDGPAVAARPRSRPVAASSLGRWAATVADATEPCLVIDAQAVIVAASPSCAELIGLPDPRSAQGRRLREALVPLVDFTAAQAQLAQAEVDKIPPLLAITSSLMARGLIRVVCPDTNHATTLDAISTPLLDHGTVVGSLTFFAKV